MVPGPKPVNQNELPGDWISIQQKLPLIRAKQTGEFILPPRSKKGRPLSFNLPGIWISIAGIDLFISHRREKLTVRCITTIGAKHFV